MAEKKALKRKAAKMEDTEEAQIQAIPRVPRPATTPSVRRRGARQLEKPLCKVVTIGSQWTHEFHRKAMIQLGHWEPKEGEAYTIGEPERHTGFTAEKRNRILAAMREEKKNMA